jgi:hypothetical protein
LQRTVSNLHVNLNLSTGTGYDAEMLVEVRQTIGKRSANHDGEAAGCYVRRLELDRAESLSLFEFADAFLRKIP